MIGMQMDLQSTFHGSLIEAKVVARHLTLPNPYRRVGCKTGVGDAGLVIAGCELTMVWSGGVWNRKMVFGEAWNKAFG